MAHPAGKGSRYIPTLRNARLVRGLTNLLNTLRGLMSPPVREAGAYFHWLDLVRGCAALTILVWHYQHFYYLTAGPSPLEYHRDVQPFYGALRLLYHYGYFAVQLFWVISGFVFASVYAGTGASARGFFVNRFARLYPLHFATLVAVAALQVASFYLQGEFQIYPINDGYHFLLNLLFVSYWGFEHGDSFNAPIWSVSVEIFIYIVFWFVLRYVFRFGLLGPLAMAFVFLKLFTWRVPGPFWECGLYFFMGCATYVWLTSLRERNAINIVSGLAAGVFGVLLLVSHVPYASDLGRVSLFCGIALFAASIDVADTARTGAKLAGLGDITYSLYLLHVPVQISAILVMDELLIDRRIVASRWFFIGFIVLMLVVATLSYRFFELPMRHWVRQRLQHSFRLGPRTTVAPLLQGGDTFREPRS